MLTDLAKTPTQLFHKAIAQSGSALNSWAINTNPRVASLKIAKLANCSETDNEDELDDVALEEIVDCMKNTADLDKLVSALTIYQVQNKL